MRLTIGCHKGGVGKTTSAVLLALQLHQDAPTVLVDGDGQGSATTWVRLAGDDWPQDLTVVPWRDPLTLPPRWGGHVVFDTAPNDPIRLRAALEHSDTALVPIGSRRGDVVQLGETVGTVAEAARGRDLSWAVFVTMRRGATRAARDAPAAIERDQLPLLRTEIPLSEAIADTFGRAPARIPGAYVDLYREITEEPQRA